MNAAPANLAADEPCSLRLAELIGALTYALDMTEGQPPGHSLRCAWIGMHIGDALGLAPEQAWNVYYTLLLKDAGCSSNAARLCELYGSDDRLTKRDFKEVDSQSLRQVAAFVLRHAGLGQGLAERFQRIFHLALHGEELATELVQTRCERGAGIARQLGFGEAVAAGIHSLDEHWNGRGRPAGLAGAAIPLEARIALVAQVADVFHHSGGAAAALAEVRSRRGTWFDPQVVDAFAEICSRGDCLPRLNAPDLESAVASLEPGSTATLVDAAGLDAIAAAFGQVVDSKSPYTFGHSERVADYADAIARRLGMAPARRRWLRRGALLHDIGKLGVSNTILDKPGSLDPEEWRQVRAHARYTEEILRRISPFAELARIAGAHHERLDGAGYPRGLTAPDISLDTRVITTADIFDAITAARPYRGAIPIPEALRMMEKTRGTALDDACLEALRAHIADAR